MERTPAKRSSLFLLELMIANFIPKYEYLPMNEHSEETNPQNTSDHLNQNIHPV